MKESLFSAISLCISFPSRQSLTHMFLKCSESIGLFSETKEPVFKPEHENAVSVNEVNEVERVPGMIAGSPTQSITASELRIVGEVVVPELIISEPEQAGDKLCQRIVAKPDLLVIEHEELINEQKRTAQPTQVCNRYGGTDAVIILESSSESKDGGILEIQPQISKVLYVFIQ